MSTIVSYSSIITGASAMWLTYVIANVVIFLINRKFGWLMINIILGFSAFIVGLFTIVLYTVMEYLLCNREKNDILSKSQEIPPTFTSATV